MENNFFFKFIFLIILINLIYFSLEGKITYIQYGKSIILDKIIYTNIFGLNVSSIKESKYVKLSIKLSYMSISINLNFKYKFFREYISDTTTHNFISDKYSDLKNELDGKIIYTYSIYKESDSLKILLFNLGCDLSGEITITSKKDF